MQQSYRKAYLTDGTQVKITEVLYQQLKIWEQEGYCIPFAYTDMLKREDDEMINADRRYYQHNASLSAQDADSSIMRDTRCCPEDHILKRERSRRLMQLLSRCSETQRRRFIKHYYIGLSYAQIARQERCSEKQVRKAVHAAERILINCEQF